MIKNIILYSSYVLVSSLGLYKLKLSNMQVGTDLVLGGFCYALGFLIWLVILKGSPLSTSFPIAASALIVSTQLVGFFLLGESIGYVKMIGITLIVVGIILIYRFAN